MLMDADAKSRSPVRVVFLSRDPSTCADLAPDASAVELLRAGCPYEAAAEVLAAPTAALVIDLRAMHPRHLRLIEIARQMDVELLAFGHLPAGMGSEEFSGVRLVSARDLGEALRRLVKVDRPLPVAEAPQPAAPPAAPPFQQRAAAAAPEELDEFLAPSEAEPAPAVRLAPAKQTAGRPAKRTAHKPARRTAGRAPEAQGEGAHTRAGAKTHRPASPEPPQQTGDAPPRQGVPTPDGHAPGAPARQPAETPAAAHIPELVGRFEPISASPVERISARSFEPISASSVEPEPPPAPLRASSPAQAKPREATKTLGIDSLLTPEELAALLENEP